MKAATNMDGVLILDKPEGLTSHDVVAVARRTLGEKRIGHTGTLDPLATGVLPLACGRATRLVRFLTASEKDYDAMIRFGVTTDTYDITGEETSRLDDVPPRDAVEAAVASLRGDYLQVPPAHSAKQVGGRRAYDMARRGEAVTLAAVPVRVSRAELVELDGARAIVSITCSAGFYVRSFAHELGIRVNTGGCLESLRRTRSGDFRLTEALTLGALEQGISEGDLIPIEALMPGFPRVVVTDEGLTRVSHGRQLEVEHYARIDGADRIESNWVRMFDSAGHLMAIGTGGHRGDSLHPAIVLT
jgi:tRNA pseudouridine55 synthase